VLEKIMVVNKKRIKFILITRRDKSRAGYRFLSRGANEYGHTSNFAETEQILITHEEAYSDIFSYLEIRGSIPLLWRQPPTLKWSPSLLIEQNDLKNQAAYDNHIKSLKKYYNELHLVNLIDKKGSQKKIGEQFTKIVRENNDPLVKYTWFDFHAETKTGWDNLSKLIGDIRESVSSLGYSHHKIYKTVVL
jgi:phosphatidylinositol 4-phosphatase